MNEESAFLSTLKNTLADDTGRLVFADWLDEREDPRGAYVRTWVKLAEIARNPQDPADHGTIEHLETLQTYRDYAAMLQELPPLNDDALSSLRQAFPGIAGIASHPKERADLILTQVEQAELEMNAPADGAPPWRIHALAAHATELVQQFGQEWFAHSASVTQPGMFRVATSDSLYDNNTAIFKFGFVNKLILTNAGLAALANNEIMEPVSEVVLPGPNYATQAGYLLYQQTPLPHVDIESLRNAPWARRVQTLHVQPAIGPRGAAELLLGDQLTALKRLNFSSAHSRQQEIDMADFIALTHGLSYQVNGREPPMRAIPVPIRTIYDEVKAQIEAEQATVTINSITPNRPKSPPTPE